MADSDIDAKIESAVAWANGVRLGMAFSTAILAVLVERKVISSADAQAAVMVAKGQAEKQASLTDIQRQVAIASLDQCLEEIRR